MKPVPQLSGLHHGLAFLIAADWTPEQALAVFELVNDLRERIWQQYALQIQAQLQQPPQGDQRRQSIPDRHAAVLNDRDQTTHRIRGAAVSPSVISAMTLQTRRKSPDLRGSKPLLTEHQPANVRRMR